MAIQKQDRLVRIGVLGCGPIAQFAHFEACRKARNAELYAICDVAEDLVAVVSSLTEGRGADLVVCANPVAATQTLAVEITRKGGRVVLFGGLPKANPMTTLDSNRIHYGEIEVVGAFSYHPTFHQLALDLLARKIVPAGLLVTHTFSLDQVTEAFETADSGKGLKVVVTA